MDMNLKAFMKAELKERGTVEFPGVPTFTDEKGNPVPFIIKQLSMKEIKEIRNLYKTTEVFRDKKNGNRPVIENGQVAVRKDYDVHGMQGVDQRDVERFCDMDAGKADAEFVMTVWICRKRFLQIETIFAMQTSALWKRVGLQRSRTRKRLLKN